jgi:methionyl-tRNA formyltransferase
MMAGSVAAVEQSSRGSTYFSKSSIDYGSLAVDLNCTAYQIKNQIRAFTFPVYQVPEVVGVRAAAADILPNKSSVPAGEVLSKTPRYVDVSTIDYDLRLYRCPTAELMDAAREDDSKSASVCMELGADINFRNYRGWSPLIIASYVGASKVIKALVSKGVDVNLPNFKGTTPLMYAMSCFEASGDSQPVELLLEAGADTSILDGRGKCLADYAVERGVKMFF